MLGPTTLLRPSLHARDQARKLVEHDNEITMILINLHHDSEAAEMLVCRFSALSCLPLPSWCYRFFPVHSHFDSWSLSKPIATEATQILKTVRLARLVASTARVAARAAAVVAAAGGSTAAVKVALDSVQGIMT